jgi:hypothetical protein
MGIQEKTARRSSSPVSRIRKAGVEKCFQNPESAVEILIEGEECPFCRFAKLKRDGNEIVCPICGYGHKPCT